MSDIDRDNPPFKNHKVLIITDVVASSKLVTEMGNLITKYGGEISCALAIVLTDVQMIDELRIKKRN